MPKHAVRVLALGEATREDYRMRHNPLIMAAVLLFGSALFAQTQPAVQIPATDGDASTKVVKTSPRHGEWVDVEVPGTDVKLHSWIVYPERADKAGVVVVIHDIFGMSDWARAVTDQLAADGFIAICPDLLSGFGPNGGGTEAMGGDARGSIGKVTADEQLKRLNAVRDYAIKLPSANGKSGCIGFCWGGGVSFTYAAKQPKLNAAAVYYGSPPTADLMAKIECPVIGHYGGNDARITATVAPTTATMKSLGKSYDPHVYEGAGHGFLRQQTGGNGANMKASVEAWPATIAFFKKNLE